METTATLTEGLTRITLDRVPPSMNKLGARGKPLQWHRMKKAWQRLLEGELMLGASRGAIPKRVASVVVTGVMEFPTNRGRDEGNFRSLVEKALGDALKNGGWIEDDTPDYYRFERLELVGGCDDKKTILDLRWEVAS